MLPQTQTPTFIRTVKDVALLVAPIVVGLAMVVPIVLLFPVYLFNFLLLTVYAQNLVLQSLPFWMMSLGGVAVVVVPAALAVGALWRRPIARAVALAVWVWGAGVGLFFLIFYASPTKFDAHYAPGFSEGAFDAVKVGDTQDRVVQSLGEPLERHLDYQGGGGSVWEYAGWPESSGDFTVWFIRRVQFDGQGRVTDAHRGWCSRWDGAPCGCRSWLAGIALGICD